jgi:hypothetical protein
MRSAPAAVRLPSEFSAPHRMGSARRCHALEGNIQQDPRGHRTKSAPKHDFSIETCRRRAVGRAERSLLAWIDSASSSRADAHAFRSMI